MKVLHVMNDFPYPPNHGGIVDIWGRLRCLVELGMDVHAVVTLKARPTEAEIAHVRKMVSRLDLVDRRPNWTGILSRDPVQVAGRNGLAHLQLKDHYDLVLGESDFSFPIFENKTLCTDRRVLRIHNDESRFMRELAEVETSRWKRMYYQEETRRFAKFSPNAFAAVDALWFSSADQYGDYVRLHPKDNEKAVWLPPPVDQDAFISPHRKTSKQVLFVGSLSVRSNIEAIEWYMAGVHPKLRHIEGYRFVIAGSTRGLPLSKSIERAAADERCTLHADVADLSALYKQSAVFVNCMLRGASIKMKTVNAAEKGVPIVSTTIGNEGTGFSGEQHLYIADDHAAFTTAISKLFSLPNSGLEMAVRAQEFLRSHYRHAEQIDRLLAARRDGLAAQ